MDRLPRYLHGGKIYKETRTQKKTCTSVYVSFGTDSYSVFLALFGVDKRQQCLHQRLRQTRVPVSGHFQWTETGVIAQPLHVQELRLLEQSPQVVSLRQHVEHRLTTRVLAAQTGAALAYAVRQRVAVRRRVAVHVERRRQQMERVNTVQERASHVAVGFQLVSITTAPQNYNNAH